MFVKQIETPKDGLDVEELAQQHHDEFGTSREFDRKAVGQAAFHCTLDKQRKHLNCWVVYDDNNKPVGYLAATIRPSFYSFRSYAVQEMWFVLPRVRGSSASIKLLIHFEQWALSHRVERIYMQVEHDADDTLVQKILRLMARIGYRTQGYIAVKVPKYQSTSIEDKDNDRSTHRGVGAEQAQV
jgi:hypothetical protein